MASDLKGIPVSPLTGVLDTRSAPDAIPAGGLRMRQNLQTTAQNKLRRGSGWRKLLSKTDYNNQDFHDQLLALTGGIRQPVTLLKTVRSTSGVRSLFLATQCTIAQLNEYSGNYRIIGSGLGGTPSTSADTRRFRTAQVNDVLAFTNDYESPMYYELEQDAIDAPVLLKNFADFETIGLTRAAVTWEWHDCLFFADVEMEGDRLSHCLIWSDFRKPISFDPAIVSSITGRKFLFSNERILGGKPGIGNTFLIYTTQGIWEMSVVGGDQSFAFRRVYNGEDNKGVGILKYENTLVSTGDGHMYAAEDGIYLFNVYAGKPERVEWLHRATSLIYDNLNTSACRVHVAKYTNNELLICVALNGAPNDCPNATLRVNLKYNVADFVDFGFTALEDYESYLVPTIRDFIIENAICTLEELTDGGYGFTNEGLPRPLPSSSAAFVPQSIYTADPKVIGDLTVENWDKAESDADSLCALLGSETLDDICRKCSGPTILVGASSQDWCLKEIGGVFYRERCMNPTAVGVTDDTGYTSSLGSYVLDGYDSLIRFAPMYTTAPGQPEVQCDEVKIFFEDAPQSPPSGIGLRVGVSAQPKDPNVDGCGIIWHQHSEQLLACVSQKTEAQHKAQNTQPSEYVHWSLFRTGRYLYAELKISGTGGDAVFTSVVADAKLLEAENY